MQNEPKTSSENCAETVPTQAQIEAAAKAMEREMFAPHELPLDDELHGKYLNTARAALTAAAEVRDDLPPGVSPLPPEQERKFLDALLVHHTIERCAQRLEELGVRYHAGHDLPAQLRALKD